jgi:hypothetical protein
MLMQSGSVSALLGTQFSAGIIWDGIWCPQITPLSEVLEEALLENLLFLLPPLLLIKVLLQVHGNHVAEVISSYRHRLRVYRRWNHFTWRKWHISLCLRAKWSSHISFRPRSFT